VAGIIAGEAVGVGVVGEFVDGRLVVGWTIVG
jgi:hypothetical protein